MSEHVSTLRLHRLRYGELPPAEVAAIRAHAAGCALCAARLADQERERLAFEAAPVPDAIRAAAALPAPANDNRGWRRLALGLAAAAAVGLAVLAAPWRPADEDPGFRTKGGVADVELWVDAGAGPARLAPGQAVDPGDPLVVRVRRPEQAWVAVAVQGADGGVDVIGAWPVDPAAPGWQAAPFGLALDDGPGPERVVVVSTAAEPDEAALREAIAAGRPARGMSWEIVEVSKAR